jgi:hypothetical protein
MRRLFCITSALILIAAAFGGPASASTTKEQADLLSVREAVWRDWFAGDTKTLEKLVPANTIAISTGEETWQDQAVIFQEAVNFHNSGGKLIRLEFPHTEVQRFGNVAVLYSKYRYEIETNGKRSVSYGRATEVFVLNNGQWTNPGWHTDSEK